MHLRLVRPVCCDVLRSASLSKFHGSMSCQALRSDVGKNVVLAYKHIVPGLPSLTRLSKTKCPEKKGVAISSRFQAAQYASHSISCAADTDFEQCITHIGSSIKDFKSERLVLVCSGYIDNHSSATRQHEECVQDALGGIIGSSNRTPRTRTTSHLHQPLE